ncbi:exostosin domain-containing protein [Mucilaginibacter lacusdianchii]|uniref:exostosin domain-containing protein n=1 Tax=Mucilaginibacter lacusdianchii TaxID=2684211 RepID=UPI00131C9E31|nr:exostosin family protein [Mucilaginibacter sp. JXJ CY 39]
MIKVFFLNRSHTPVADESSPIATAIKQLWQTDKAINLDCTIEDADALILQENISFKDYKYIKLLKNDPVFKQYAHKIFTINYDDGATGVLKGAYVCLKRSRFDERFHASVPYLEFANNLITKQAVKTEPAFLATWRGNTKSNSVRSKIVELYANDKAFDVYTTNSWFNHSKDEKQAYVDSLLNAKFALAPAGWAPTTFRLYESMALGRCPVIIADEFVPPVGPDWNSFSISVPENKIESLKQVLQEKEPQYEQLGNRAAAVWEQYFAAPNGIKYYADQLMRLIKSSPADMSVQQEFNRWGSSKMYHSNGWTLSQRLRRKLKKLRLFSK